jgi:hypothetical protein
MQRRNQESQVSPPCLSRFTSQWSQLPYLHINNDNTCLSFRLPGCSYPCKNLPAFHATTIHSHHVIVHVSPIPTRRAPKPQFLVYNPVV